MAESHKTESAKWGSSKQVVQKVSSCLIYHYTVFIEKPNFIHNINFYDTIF